MVKDVLCSLIEKYSTTSIVCVHTGSWWWLTIDLNAWEINLNRLWKWLNKIYIEEWKMFVAIIMMGVCWLLGTGMGRAVWHFIMFTRSFIWPLININYCIFLWPRLFSFSVRTCVDSIMGWMCAVWKITGLCRKFDKGNFSNYFPRNHPQNWKLFKLSNHQKNFILSIYLPLEIIWTIYGRLFLCRLIPFLQMDPNLAICSQYIMINYGANANYSIAMNDLQLTLTTKP